LDLGVELFSELFILPVELRRAGGRGGIFSLEGWILVALLPYSEF